MLAAQPAINCLAVAGQRTGRDGESDPPSGIPPYARIAPSISRRIRLPGPRANAALRRRSTPFQRIRYTVEICAPLTSPSSKLFHRTRVSPPGSTFVRRVGACSRTGTTAASAARGPMGLKQQPQPPRPRGLRERTAAPAHGTTGNRIHAVAAAITTAAAPPSSLLTRPELIADLRVPSASAVRQVPHVPIVLAASAGSVRRQNAERGAFQRFDEKIALLCSISFHPKPAECRRDRTVPPGIFKILADSSYE